MVINKGIDLEQSKLGSCSSNSEENNQLLTFYWVTPLFMDLYTCQYSYESLLGYTKALFWDMANRADNNNSYKKIAAKGIVLWQPGCLSSGQTHSFASLPHGKIAFIIST